MIGDFIVLSHFQAREIINYLDKKKEIYVSLDLGRSKDKVKIENKGVILPNGEKLNFSELEKIKKDENKCYVVLENKAYPILIFSEKTGWVRSLRPTKTAPTSTVAGFIMHRIKDIDPLKDTELKLHHLKLKKHSIVLDTCTGLGYSAIESAKNAKRVITVEIDEAALKIAKLNPWSKELFEFKNIEIRIGDIREIIKKFKDNFFTHIIHDPPNARLAGELYSEALYKDFFKKLRFKGMLFHYIGNPEKKQGSSLTPGVIKRLKSAGFKKVKKLPSAFGVLAYKL